MAARGDLDAARPVRPQIERPLDLGDVLLDVVAAGLALFGRRVEHPDVAAAGGEDRRDPPAERACAVDRHRPLVDVFSERVRHGDSCRSRGGWARQDPLLPCMVQRGS